MDIKDALEGINNMTDEALLQAQFAVPWQSDLATGSQDADGFAISKSSRRLTREDLQQVCWEKFNTSPHINTAVRGQVGRLTGWGFETSSEIFEINQVVQEIEFDPRNRLYNFWPKFVGRSNIEGELFLMLSVHKDGFIEVDFIDPSTVQGAGDDGIIYHSKKATMPLFYSLKDGSFTELVPSIFIARYPELLADAKKNLNFSAELTKGSQDTSPKFKKLKGFNRFIVAWDKSFITRRNVSYLRTVLEWLNFYENLKKYEIDHKKSSGAYVWVVTMEDPKAFRLWANLTDEERRKTGIMAKKTPGGTLVLPPGMKLTAVNPNLPKISEADTDILHMVTGGLNEPEDVSTGQSKGTFASVKASRGPMSDRISDEIAYFDRFLKYDFWGSIFFLKSAVSDFPENFSVRTAVSFENKKPKFKNIKVKPEFLIDVAYPNSEVNDAEASARAYLGVKHGSTYETLGIPNAEIAKKMGLGNYKKLRLQHATEEDKYPELLPTMDQEGQQEKSEAEPGKDRLKKRAVAKKEEKEEVK